MNRIIVGVLLVLASANACAEWVKVADSMNGKVHHYLDPTTLKKQGTVMRVVTLTDYEEPQPISESQRFHSVKMQDEFDCAAQTGRHLTLTALAGNMGAGEIVATEPRAAAVRKVAPDTPDEDMFKYVCARN
ncbi:MAG: surface-adhesin E family protein [Burkholderiaceae bacterium]